jgi:segregation and condensation protein B
MDITLLKQILEGAILAANEPVSFERLKQIFTETDAVTDKQIKEAIALLIQDTENRAYELKEVASGYRFQVKSTFSPWLIKLWEEKPQKYSKAVLETLALIAYRQPVTRTEVEEIRGVTSSTHIFKTLQDREWIKVVGHKDVAGRPGLYATTKAFLDYFNLRSLEELPTLSEIMDLDKVDESLGHQLELSLALQSISVENSEETAMIEEGTITEKTEKTEETEETVSTISLAHLTQQFAKKLEDNHLQEISDLDQELDEECVEPLEYETT